MTSADIPWLAQAEQIGGTTRAIISALGGAAFNPANPNELFATAGTGVWTMTQVPTSGATSSTAVTWTDHSVGIENLCRPGNRRAPRRQSGSRLLGSAFLHDHQSQRLSLDLWPCQPDNIVAGFSARLRLVKPKFSRRPRRLVGHWRQSGYSTNGGQTWTKFPTAYSRGWLVVHRWNDRRQHDAKLHLGSGGRHTSLIIRSTEARPGTRSRFPA